MVRDAGSFVRSVIQLADGTVELDLVYENTPAPRAAAHRPWTASSSPIRRARP